WPRHRGRGNVAPPDRPARRVRASMWPRHRGRGNSPTAFCSRRVMSALQCGHGTEAVETASPWLVMLVMLVLQCGHGTEAVETLAAPVPRPRRDCDASMWPRHRGRGNPSSELSSTNRLSGLNGTSFPSPIPVSIYDREIGSPNNLLGQSRLYGQL